MFDYRSLIVVPNRDLARVDLAEINLACAEGLPHPEPIDWASCTRTLDAWAESCWQFTLAAMPLFHAGRCDYPDSEPKFRMQAMLTHLQRDLGVRYHPDRIAEETPFRCEDSFLNGIIQGEGGTCASLPVLYVAVGRRIGYPLFLCTTRGHLFFRWDSRPVFDEYFNVEGSSEGVSFFPDEHYCTGKYEMPPETVRECGYLETLSPHEEVASFLCQRGECWMEEKNWYEAIRSFIWANEFDPRRKQHLFLAAQAMGVWDREIRKQLPSRLFPRLDMGLPASPYRHFPRELERRLIGMKMSMDVLANGELERKWWSTLRGRPHSRPHGMPREIRLDVRWDGFKGDYEYYNLKG